MKKLILMCCLLFSVSLVGCGGKRAVDPDVIDNRDNDRFITIYLGNADYVYVDKETRVQYLYVDNGYDGGLEILVDSDGKPLLYEGED